MKCQVTYLHHCGYQVETDHSFLVFDWIEGKIKTSNKTKICFITHSHQDHYRPDVFEKDFDTFIVSNDVKTQSHDKIIWVKEGDQLSPLSLTLEVLGSTDLGVSYYVEVDGVHLFFAGDLNNWHWAKESTQEEIDEMNEQFLKKIKPLQGKNVDVLFIDIDPRLQVNYDLGAKQLLEIIQPKAIFPMHFTSDIHKIREYYATTQIENLIPVFEDNSEFELDW